MRSHIEIDIAAQPCQFSSQPTRKSVAAQAMSDFHDDMPWSYLNGGHEPPFFSGEDHRKKNKKNTCRQGYRVFSNPFIMENDGWVTLQPNPVDLCRWRKKPTGWILALQNTIKVQLEVHWGPLPRCHLKLLRDGMEELWVGFFFSFWFGLFGRKTKVWKKKVEKLYLRF